MPLFTKPRAALQVVQSLRDLDHGTSPRPFRAGRIACATTMVTACGRGTSCLSRTMKYAVLVKVPRGWSSAGTSIIQQTVPGTPAGVAIGVCSGGVCVLPRDFSHVGVASEWRVRSTNFRNRTVDIARKAHRRPRSPIGPACLPSTSVTSTRCDNESVTHAGRVVSPHISLCRMIFKRIFFRV